MNPQRFLTHTLKTSPNAEPVPRILAVAIQAVDPAAAVARHLHCDGDMLTIGGSAYDLHSIRRLLVIGFGKASLPMAEASIEILGDLVTAGIVIPKGQGARGKGQGASGKWQGARGKWQVARGKRQGARGKRQGARGKRQGARGKRQGARGKRQVHDSQFTNLPITNLPITNLPITNLPITNLPISIFPASHPVPDERSVAGAQKIIDLLSTTTANDLVICLISGGGSALLTSPVAGISLTDLQSLTSALLACGATINEINTLRKHLSRVKGGQLARWIAPARSATLILSDVVGDPLDVVASGPTVPDSSTYADALAVVDKYNLGAQIPPAIMTHLQSGANGNIPETPKPGDPVFKRAENSIIGNNLQAAQAAIEQAKAEGFNTLLLTTSLQGEARAAGRMLAAVARQIAATGDPIPRPACIVAGGETTVTLSLPHPQPLSQGERGVFLPLPLGAPFGDDKGRGEGGLGGRNQELALAAVSELAGLPDVMLIALATDGDDGPTDAAGAVVTGETLARARELGLDPAEFLARNDSYHFFEPLGDLLKPGPTQTNVCDLTFIFAF